MNKYFNFKRKKIFIFIDRPDKADDNAEHLYRHLLLNHPEYRIYFIINKSSKDWERLKNDNFNLVEYGGLYHFLLLFSSSFLISSHLPKYKIIFIPKYIIKKIVNYKFIFLQHGITHNDISKIINRHRIDLIISASYREYDNFINNEKYNVREKNVALTGFPRFDTLLSAPKKDKNKKIILVMPTWRASFTEHSKEGLVNFKNSNYCSYWSGFLNSSYFKYIIDTYQYEVVFFPHPEIIPFIEELNIPAYIDVKSYKLFSIQKFLVSSNLLITDYSSVAFDMAIQKKPICYFQFDEDDFFSESHLYKKCYFNYHEDAFGDVSNNVEDFCYSIEKICENNGNISNRYLKRVVDFFPYFDAKNSKRIVDEINNL